MNNPSIFGGTPYYPTYPSPIQTVPYPGTPRMNVIAGRSVNSVDEIMPAEVPMDSSLAVFPKNDGSVIYVRHRGGDGVINTKYYVPAPDDFVEMADENSDPDVSNTDIMNSIANMTDQLQDIKNIMSNKSYKNNGNRGNKHQNNNNQNGSEEKVENNA